MHCDSTMSHYLKIALDCIFGEKNFRNEIIWHRNFSVGKGSQYSAKKFGENTDTIFFYTKSNKFHLKATTEIDENSVEIQNKFNKIDENNRRYNTTTPLFRSKTMGPRKALCYEWKGFKNPHPSGWRLSKERLEEEYQKGNIVIRGDGKLERRSYLDDYEGAPLANIWLDLPRVSGAESTGYPTQKPLALLERIIKASSVKGGVVLDPFCGCATTCVAAHKLERKWIGIDVSHKAYDLVKMRLEKEVHPDLYVSEPDFQIKPPSRTDKTDIQEIQGYVYVISNDSWKGKFKVGIAKDPKRRLNSFQTSHPDRSYKLRHKVLTPHYKEIEKQIHKEFNGDHEWVEGDLDTIIEAIKDQANRYRESG